MLNTLPALLERLHQIKIHKGSTDLTKIQWECQKNNAGKQSKRYKWVKKGSKNLSFHDHIPEAICGALLSSSPPCPSTFQSTQRSPDWGLLLLPRVTGQCFFCWLLSVPTSSPLVPPYWKQTPFSLSPPPVIHFLYFLHFHFTQLSCSISISLNNMEHGVRL